MRSNMVIRTYRSIEGAGLTGRKMEVPPASRKSVAYVPIVLQRWEK